MKTKALREGMRQEGRATEVDPAPAASRPNSLWRQWQGPLTRDLVLRPGQFGLGRVPAKIAPDATTRTVCGFCSTGCSLDVHLKDGVAVNLSPTSDYPVNLGMACPKGWEALTPLAALDRGTTPLLRDANGEMRPEDWHTAMTEFCARMKGIQQRHGPDSIAFLSTGQICTEEMALLGCLFKFGMGGLHCDSNTRQCMATAHVAYKQSFGFDAPPFTYADFEESDVLVFVGANPCIAHPIMWQRVMRNRYAPEIIVVDPRKTETAMAATQHYALQPKSDLTLLYGLANRLIALGAVKREFVDAHTAGFDEFARFVEQFTPESVSAATGLSLEQLERFATTVARGQRVSFWWTMGVNQSHEATRTAQAIINLALMTGNIGRPGTGANSITGQCNAMGSRLFSNITGLLGGRDFLNAAHRVEVSTMLGVPEEKIPAANSWAYDQIVEGIRGGNIKGLWVIATNSSHSWIHQTDFNEVLAKLDFLVVQDMYPTTETAQRAHLFLPAAGWGEKEGTFINSERRIGLVKKVAHAPGQALSDFSIFRLVAQYWGCGETFAPWNSPEAVFQILKEISRGQPCDISGIRDYRMIDECGGIQWPFSEGFNSQIASNEREGGELPHNPQDGPQNFGIVSAGGDSPSPHDEGMGRGPGERGHRGSNEQPAPPQKRNPSPLPSPRWFLAGRGNGRAVGHSAVTAVSAENAKLKFPTERRLFEDGKFFHPDGRAQFLFDEPRPPAEPTDAEFPFVLLTGRGTSAQWHTGSRTSKSDVLRALAPPGCYVELNPADAARLDIAPNARVRVTSRRASLLATAFVTPTVQPGQVFIPMHYAEVNRLTHPSFDPHSRQPNYKHCAVRVESLG